MRLPAEFVKRLGGSLPLMSLRLLQLARPFLLVLVLRFTDKDIAAHYAALLGVYVITLELFNVVAPTDRLYLPESTWADLRAVLRRRAIFAPLLSTGAWIALTVWGNMTVMQALVLALAGFGNSLAVAVSSAFYGRVRMARLAQAEAASWVTQGLSLGAFLAGWPIVVGFLIYISEQVSRAIVLAHKTLATLRLADSGFLAGVEDKSRHSVGVMLAEGATVTAANHIHRVPFVLYPGVVDPIFLIGVQASSAVYNLLMGMASRLRMPVKPLLGLAVSLIAAAGVVLASGIGEGFWRLSVQTCLICLLAVIHGVQMTHVPGPAGVALATVPRLVLTGGLAAIAVAGSLVGPAFFLLSPAVLSLSLLSLGISSRDRADAPR